MLTVTAIIHLVCRHSKLKAFTNWNCFSVSESSRGSSNQTIKGVLYSSMVCDFSLNSVDNIAYCIYLFYPTRNALYSKEDSTQIQ